MLRPHASLAALALITTFLPSQGGRQLFETYGAGFTRTGGYGTSVAVIGDVNGDFFTDIAVGDPTNAFLPAENGIAEVVSGADGSVLLTLLSVSGDLGLGEKVAAVGDISGDDVPDVLVASRSSVVLFSGADGSVVTRLPTPADDIAGPGNWNNDQVPDLALIIGGQVRVLSGIDLSTLFTFGTNATALAAIPGTTAGTHDLAVLHSAGLTLFSTLGSVWTKPGYQTVESAGDLDGDQRGDVVAVAAGGASTDVLSGVDGTILRTFPGGNNASGGSDLNGDGVVDVAVGDPFENSGRGSARTYSGADGTLLFARSGQQSGELLGWDVAMHPGAGATTRPALLVGSLAKYDGSIETGALLAIAQAAPGELDGAFVPFGQRCNFQNVMLRPGRGLPTIGQSYVFRFDNNTTPIALALLIVGASDTTWAGLSLPLTLPGPLSCTLYVSIDIAQLTGFVSFQALNIPLNASLVGVDLYIQGLELDTRAGLIQTTDAATVTIGN